MTLIPMKEEQISDFPMQSYATALLLIWKRRSAWFGGISDTTLPQHSVLLATASQ